jgi:hypothetical protein
MVGEEQVQEGVSISSGVLLGGSEVEKQASELWRHTFVLRAGDVTEEWVPQPAPMLGIFLESGMHFQSTF